LELYSLEADHQSNPVAMNALGHLYGEGKHVPEDKEKSVMYYNRSAKLDNPEGLYHVGSMMLVIDIE
jgi:TPR repeat protein